VRLFFALWPPRDAAEALHAWALEAQRQTGGRVTRVETIHLTLAFLGEVEEGALAGLKSLSFKEKAHALPIDESGCWKHNSIVWVGPERTPPELVAIVARLMVKKGQVEKRPFAAHVSLIRKAARAAGLPALPTINWPVDEVVLVRSQLSAAGAGYEVLQRYPLSRAKSRAGGSGARRAS
jgi:2'-5' RNA ligase